MSVCMIDGWMDGRMDGWMYGLFFLSVSFAALCPRVFVTQPRRLPGKARTPDVLIHARRPRAVGFLEGRALWRAWAGSDLGGKESAQLGAGLDWCALALSFEALRLNESVVFVHIDLQAAVLA